MNEVIRLRILFYTLQQLPQHSAPRQQVYVPPADIINDPRVRIFTTSAHALMTTLPCLSFLAPRPIQSGYLISSPAPSTT
jgi:hypothetical protein